MNFDETSDAEIETLERLIPSQARKATHEAFIHALIASPKGVLCIEAGYLVRRLPDGTRIIQSKAKPRRKVNVGQVVDVRKISD